MVTKFAWAAIAVADLGVVVYGLFALAAPESLAVGYESFTGRSWAGLLASDPRAADYLVLLYRLVGALNVAAGSAGLLIAMLPFRSGARWSWFVLLAVNVVAFGAPITYDQIVGEIGAPEVLELVAFAVILLGLAVSFREIVLAGPETPPTPSVRVASSGARDHLSLWASWLTVVGMTLGVGGFLMAALAGSALFGPIHALIDPAFFGQGPADEATAGFRAWVYGAWGATIAGWGATVALVAWHGIRAGKRWAWWALSIGTGVWFVIDTGVSTVHGVVANVVLNAVIVTWIAVPLVATRRVGFVSSTSLGPPTGSEGD